MITDKDMQQIGRCIKANTRIDTKIAVGLALEKGMDIEELASKCISEKWVVPEVVSDEFLIENHDIIVDGIGKALMMIYEE